MAARGKTEDCAPGSRSAFPGTREKTPHLDHGSDGAGCPVHLLRLRRRFGQLDLDGTSQFLAARARTRNLVAACAERSMELSSRATLCGPVAQFGRRDTTTSSSPASRAVCGSNMSPVTAA